MGAHTAKSNLVRPPAAHRCRKRRGGRAGWLGVRFVPSPRPSLRGKGGEGSRIRCGGEPLRRDGGFSHRTAVSYWAGPYRTAHRTRSAYKGCRLPPVSTTHAQKGARGRGTRGAGRREGCGVWGGLSGPGPAVRAAREAAGGARPPGGYPGGSSSGPRPLHA